MRRWVARSLVLARIVFAFVLLGIVVFTGSAPASVAEVGSDQGAFVPPDRVGTFSNLVDSAGGVLTEAGGAITVDVPSGAVDDDALVQIATENSSGGLIVDLSVVGLSDASPRQFDIPVSLEIKRSAAPAPDGELLVSQAGSETAVEQEFALDAIMLPAVNVGRYTIASESEESELEAAFVDLTSEGGRLVTGSGDVSLEVSAQPHGGGLEIDYQEVMPTGIGDLHVLKQFDLTAAAAGSGEQVTTFENPLSLSRCGIPRISWPASTRMT